MLYCRTTLHPVAPSLEAEALTDMASLCAQKQKTLAVEVAAAWRRIALKRALALPSPSEVAAVVKCRTTSLRTSASPSSAVAVAVGCHTTSLHQVRRTAAKKYLPLARAR